MLFLMTALLWLVPKIQKLRQKEKEEPMTVVAGELESRLLLRTKLARSVSYCPPRVN